VISAFVAYPGFLNYILIKLIEIHLHTPILYDSMGMKIEQFIYRFINN
jgi:hypothetical protein